MVTTKSFHNHLNRPIDLYQRVRLTTHDTSIRDPEENLQVFTQVFSHSTLRAYRYLEILVKDVWRRKLCSVSSISSTLLGFLKY